MNVELKNIELFENLAQLEVDGNYYDFHNDFDCLKFLFNNQALTFFFKNPLDNSEISLTFHHVEPVKFDFENLEESQPLTLDTLYRGRFETAKGLLEFSDAGKSYLYFDFIDGLSGEFFSDEFTVSKRDSVQ